MSLKQVLAELEWNRAEVRRLTASSALESPNASWSFPEYKNDNPKYSFPIVVGENGAQWYLHQLEMWGIQPPFIDRYHALYTLLTAAYQSVTNSAKPIVTLATTSPGFGKTRLLVEWVIQVFLHPFIIASFLAANAEINCTINTDVEEQIRTALSSANQEQISRANFLLRLYNAAKTPTVITVHAELNSALRQVLGNSTKKPTEAEVTLSKP